MLAWSLCHPYSYPGNLWRHCRERQGCSSLQSREESWGDSTNRVCGFLYCREFFRTYFFDLILSCILCDQRHWTCSVLHTCIWILVEQTRKFVCIFTAKRVLLEMAIHILWILPFLVLCLYSFIFNKNPWQESYFVCLRKAMESLPDEMTKCSSHREQRCINQCESNYE